jgi:hypothetical protein
MFCLPVNAIDLRPCAVNKTATVTVPLERVRSQRKSARTGPFGLQPSNGCLAGTTWSLHYWRASVEGIHSFTVEMKQQREHVILERKRAPAFHSTQKEKIKRR